MLDGCRNAIALLLAGVLLAACGTSTVGNPAETPAQSETAAAVHKAKPAGAGGKLKGIISQANSGGKGTGPRLMGRSGWVVYAASASSWRCMAARSYIAAPPPFKPRTFIKGRAAGLWADVRAHGLLREY